MALSTPKASLLVATLLLAGCGSPEADAPASPTELGVVASGNPAESWTLVLSGEVHGGSSSLHMWVEAYHGTFSPADGSSWDRRKPIADSQTVDERFAVSKAQGDGGCLSVRVEGPSPSGTHASRFDVVVTRRGTEYVVAVEQVFPPSGENGPVWPGPPC